MKRLDLLATGSGNVEIYTLAEHPYPLRSLPLALKATCLYCWVKLSHPTCCLHSACFVPKILFWFAFWFWVLAGSFAWKCPWMPLGMKHFLLVKRHEMRLSEVWTQQLQHFILHWVFPRNNLGGAGEQRPRRKGTWGSLGSEEAGVGLQTPGTSSLAALSGSGSVGTVMTYPNYGKVIQLHLQKRKWEELLPPC